MALLTKQVPAITGTVLTLGAATAGGDTVLVDSPGVFLEVDNADASPKTVTLVVPGTLYGQPIADVPVVVANGTRQIIGPIPLAFGDASGIVSITYSAVTSLTIAAIKAF